jgi:ketol-acid reductoisomerase
MLKQMNIFTEADADASVLEGKTVAVAGYGNQGRPQALNLRESGFDVIIGAREGRSGWKRAHEDGFAVVTIGEAARKADVLMMLLPDEVQAEVYNNEIRKVLRPGAALCFAHGFAVTFGGVEPEGFDCLLVAPKGQGRRLREAYVEGSGLPCLLGVARDVSGNARSIALALAWGLGCLRAGAIETTFREETVSDLFGEQAVLCGGVVALMKRAFDLLVDRGYSPEVAYIECAQELTIIVDLIARLGFSGMRDVISSTAAYGSLAFGEDLIDDAVRKRMEELFERIDNGAFARAWLDERRAGGAEFAALRERERKLLIETVGKRVRAIAAGTAGPRGCVKEGT